MATEAERQRFMDFAERFREANALCDRIMRAKDVKFQKIQVKILVDCYGVYHNLFQILNDLRSKYNGDNWGVELPMMAELAWSTLKNLEWQIREAEARSKEIPALSASPFENDCTEIISKENLRQICLKFIEGEIDEQNLRIICEVFDIQFNYEWFFAPFPKAELENRTRNQLTRAWRDQSLEKLRRLERVLEQARRSEITLFNKVRDYSIYADFIEKIAKRMSHPENQEIYHKGKYNFFVSDEGLRYFDEKQVDTLICIRAMEILLNYEADVVCIVFSDTDFVPLLYRFKQAEMSIYQSYAVSVKDRRLAKEHQLLVDEGIFLPSTISWHDWEQVLDAVFDDAKPEIRKAINQEIEELAAAELKEWYENLGYLDSYYDAIYANSQDN